MIKRVAIAVILSGGIAGITSLPIEGQTSSVPPLVITAYNGGTATPFTVPKTPWRS